MLVNSGDPSSPMQFITSDGRVFGQFYNSRDSKYHIAQYVPYRMPPRKYLCGKTGNFSPSRRATPAMQCEECFSRIWRM
jgi:hypothetical protein